MQADVVSIGGASQCQQLGAFLADLRRRFVASGGGAAPEVGVGVWGGSGGVARGGHGR